MQEIVDIASDSAATSDRVEEFRVPAKLVDTLRKTYPQAEIETTRTWSRGRIAIRLRNAKDLPEPPERAKRIQEMVTLAAAESETQFFVNDALYSALKRRYPQAELDTICQGPGFHEFRIRNAKDLLKLPPPASKGRPREMVVQAAANRVNRRVSKRTPPFEHACRLGLEGMGRLK